MLFRIIILQQLYISIVNSKASLHTCFFGRLYGDDVKIAILKTILSPSILSVLLMDKVSILSNGAV